MYCSSIFMTDIDKFSWFWLITWSNQHFATMYGVWLRGGNWIVNFWCFSQNNDLLSPDNWQDDDLWASIKIFCMNRKICCWWNIMKWFASTRNSEGNQSESFHPFWTEFRWLECCLFSSSHLDCFVFFPF